MCVCVCVCESEGVCVCVGVCVCGGSVVREGVCVLDTVLKPAHAYQLGKWERERESGGLCVSVYTFQFLLPTRTLILILIPLRILFPFFLPPFLFSYSSFTYSFSLFPADVVKMGAVMALRTTLAYFLSKEIKVGNNYLNNFLSIRINTNQ